MTKKNEPKLDGLIRDVRLHARVVEAVNTMAKQENRSVANMASTLIEKALKAKGAETK